MCHHEELTDVDYTLNCCVCMCFTALFCTGLCLIPCCINTCKDARHYCRSCQRQIGINKL